MSKPTFVYFIRPVGMDGPIKIGSSDTPPSRLATFAPWSPYPLELIGAVPGDTRDENFLHRAFAAQHSHREWFHSSPELRAAIKTIIEENSVDGARKFLKAKKTIRKSTRIVRAPAHQQFLDLQAAVCAAEKKLRNASEKRPFAAPEDVSKIIKQWGAQVYRGTGFAPTLGDLALVNEFLADPAKYAIFPKWWHDMPRRLSPTLKDSICIPVFLPDEVAA